MSLILANLDQATRKSMISELDSDIAAKNLYLSQRLSPHGLQKYPDIIRQALEHYDDTWLASELNLGGILNTTEQRRATSGVTTTVKVPVTAAGTMAEGEFNRFYMRGLCLRAISEGKTYLEIYRAKQVTNPRSKSLKLTGTTIAAVPLLDDLRKSIGQTQRLACHPDQTPD
jgi:hypothetical protein